MILKVARLCLISLKSFPQNYLSQFINNERLLVVHWNTPPDASRWINSSQKEFPQHSTHLTPDENILLFLQPCVKLSRKTFLDESQRHKVVSSPYTDTLVILEKLKKPSLLLSPCCLSDDTLHFWLSVAESTGVSTATAVSPLWHHYCGLRRWGSRK